MYSPIATKSPNFSNRMLVLILGFFVATVVLTSVANAQIDGFTEPFKRIELSSDESGAIAELLVTEGQLVEDGDVVARLDTRVQQLQVEIAEQMAKSTSQLTAAKNTLTKRQAILQRLQRLNSSGHASNSEIIRAEMEVSIAQAKFLAAKEEQAVREVEQRRAEVQLERRTITSPFTGVVAKIHRKEGEFLSPVKPEVVTLVQVDKLLASFAVDTSQIEVFEVGKKFNLELSNGETITAVVHSISVETDAQSSTVEVKFVIENPAGRYRSGDRCTLNI